MLITLVVGPVGSCHPNPCHRRRCSCRSRLFRALVELERASMLPSSQEEAAGLAARIRLRGKGDAVTTILPEVRFSPVLPFSTVPYATLSLPLANPFP